MTEGFVYSGEALRAVAMPVGGIGAGQIAICGDGGLRQWQICNEVWHEAFVPDSFFAIWARPREGLERRSVIARVLQSDAHYDDDIGEVPSSSDHVVPDEARALLSALPGVQEIEFTGRYPVADIRYLDECLPVSVSLRAYSPFIPLEPEDSGLPAVVFTFSVLNEGGVECDVGLMATLQNAVGWDGVSHITGVRNYGYGGNENVVVREGGITAILMKNTRLDVRHAKWGEMALATFAPDADVCCQWEDREDLWRKFAFDGRLGGPDVSVPSAPGRTWNAAIAVPLSLEPGESQEITFVYSWYFPNRYVNWSQSHLGIENGKSQLWVGNAYASRFPSSYAVSKYVSDNFDRLREGTFAFVESFYDSSLPESLIARVGSQISVLRSPSCFWAGDGRLYGFEGCNGASTVGDQGGCCPLNCTHVWNYEQTVSRLFPSLERTMREVDLEVQQHPSGYIPHRTVFPLYLPRAWDRPIGGPAKPALDGMLGTVLKSYREFRQCGDNEWLERFWPRVSLLMNHVMTEYDVEGNGVIPGEQPNTYDISIFGPNTFVGGLYLAALAATEKMAEQMGDASLADECRRRLARGALALDQSLWNGEYYIQDVDLGEHPRMQWSIGCHSDQLFGQWWANQLGLGYVLPAQHVHTAIQSIFRYNFRDKLASHEQKPRVFAMEDEPGLLVCTWPKGGRPDEPTLYSDEVWTGLEYEVAALLIWEGMVDEGFRLLEAVCQRYDGRRRSPWNEVECGDHYVRAMSSWSVLDAAGGYTYDASQGLIGFDPRIRPEKFRGFFIASSGWGCVRQEMNGGEQRIWVECHWGSIRAARLRIRLQDPEAVLLHAHLGSDELSCRLEKLDSSMAEVVFREQVDVPKGSALAIVFGEEREQA